MQIKIIATGSTGNCYQIKNDNSCLLIEAGIPIKKIKKALNFKLSDVDGILISHRHGDHCCAVKDMLKTEIDCHVLQDTKDFLNLNHHRLHVFEFKKQFQIGSFTILPFPVVHCDTDGEPCPNVGFLIVSGKERLLYITDTAYCKYTFPGLIHLMIEANYKDSILDDNIKRGVTPRFMKDRLSCSHMELENTVKLIEANDLSQVKEIYLIHLSQINADADLFKKTVQEYFGISVII